MKVSWPAPFAQSAIEIKGNHYGCVLEFSTSEGLIQAKYRPVVARLKARGAGGQVFQAFDIVRDTFLLKIVAA